MTNMNFTLTTPAASLLYNISNELTSTSGTSVAYDADGNMLTKTTSTAALLPRRWGIPLSQKPTLGKNCEPTSGKPCFATSTTERPPR